jgi:hypothetical protein
MIGSVASWGFPGQEGEAYPETKIRTAPSYADETRPRLSGQG